MRRMIEKLDDFKRKDGEDEFIKVEGKAAKNVKAKYIKCGITHNLATIVFDIIIPAGVAIGEYAELASIKIPNVLYNHLLPEGKDSLGDLAVQGCSLTVSTTVGGLAKKQDCTLYLHNSKSDGKLIHLHLAQGSGIIAQSTDTELRYTASFIL